MIRELASSRTLSSTDFRLYQNQSEMEVSIALTAADQRYYRDSGKSLRTNGDLRKLYEADDELDETAIYSFLQFGAAIPPLSPWKKIRRFVPGAVTTFPISGAPTIRGQSPLRSLSRESPSPNIDQQISMVVSTLDRLLLEHCAGRAVTILFSGGVDSGLLAARASVLGLENVTLVNYAFGPNDPESLLAEKMAQHLGLKFIRIVETTDGSDVADVLQNAGLYYQNLFCDHSVAPTCALVRAVISRCDGNGIVLDGTGADGGFGLFGKAAQWRRLYSLPAWGRQIGSMAYRMNRAWRHDGRIEYWLRLLRRSCQWRYPAVAVAQNPLLGIAYHPSGECINAIKEHLARWLSQISSSDPRLQLAAIDLALICASIFAQKTRSLFNGTSLDVVYPFLLPDMVDVALASGDWAGSEKEPKWILKAALAQHVPATMVYRKKSGFTFSTPDKFGQKAFLAAFDKLLEPQSPMHRFVDREFLVGIRPKLATKQRLPAQTERFVWGAVFGNEWIEQVSTGRSRTPDFPSCCCHPDRRGQLLAAAGSADSEPGCRAAQRSSGKRQ